MDGFRAQWGSYRLLLSRESDHWRIGVFDAEQRCWLYDAQTTNADHGRRLLLDYLRFCRPGLRDCLLEDDLVWAPF